MKEKNNRRSFLKNLSISSLGVMAAPGILFADTDNLTLEENLEDSAKRNGKTKVQNKKRGFNETYTGEYLKRIAFPIGGIGAGMFCMEGNGAISHLSIRHKPEIFYQPQMFAAIAVKGQKTVAKVIEGPVPDYKIFGQPGTGNGASGTVFGLPRFNSAEFITRFPFGYVNLKDEELPITVQISGWSPFIPTDEDNASMPLGALEYKFLNKGKSTVEAVFSYNSKNFVVEKGEKGTVKKLDNGFILSQEGSLEKQHLKTDFAIFTNETETVIDHCWFRGGWFDPLTMVWNTIKEGNVKSNEPIESGSPGASLYIPFKLKEGAEKTIRLMIAWYVPDSLLHSGEKVKDDKEGCGIDCCTTPSELGLEEKSKLNTGNYKPWYSSKFKNVNEVVDYWKENYRDLQKKSELFRDTFYSSTLPAEVIEAVAANLSILKSPTVMRQYDGRMWNWEGCSDDNGCCSGSCTHVWNYAQALPHIFPSLERSLRHTEFCEDQNAAGHQTFRANLPISPLKHDFYAAADGQLGGIMKVYREWRISGDNNWLEKMYPMVKRSIDYCIKTWDPKSKGIVEEPHHNTYDIEFWGPDGMCTSFYLGALKAIIEMGKFLKSDVARYKDLYSKGKKYMESELYDGEYFIQKIQWIGLNASNPVDAQSLRTDYTKEALDILKKEGPKYQYGKGCLSDGVLGGWIAQMSGLEDPIDREKTKSHLLAVHKYNLKKDLSDHANPQRPSYAVGHEGGLLLCSWPKGGKLSLPFVYSDEVWTGIEYQVASHLMLMGLVEEGLEIVKACRNRYDGRIRNPFNEYECGHWYARAMSSYGMIQGLTGVRYDAIDKTLYIDSKIGDFNSFISTEKGFGSVSLKNGKPSLKVVYGSIDVQNVLVSGKQSKLG